jgi:GAF domain-containing protein
MRKPAVASAWCDLAGLGERLHGADSLVSQRDYIQQTAERLVDCRVDVWLNEALFRLPDWDASSTFPAEPPEEAMRHALVSGRTFVPAPGTGEAQAAFLLSDHDLVLGVLQARRAGSGFRQEELDALAALVSIAALGLIASHRVAVEHFRIGQLNLVGKVSAQIASLLDLDELASRVTELIQKTFNFYYVAIFTLDPVQSVLRFRSCAAAPGEDDIDACHALEVVSGQGLIGTVAQSGQEIVCDDVRAETRFRVIESLPKTRSEVVLPLKVEDQVLGVLDVQSDRERAFHPYDLLVLRALADSVAIAVQRTRLYNDLRRRAEQLAVIAEVSRSVNSTLNLETLMRDVAVLVRERFGYPHVHLFTVHPNRRQIIYEAGSGPRGEALMGYMLNLDDPEGIIPWVARNGQPVLANDVSQDERYRPSPFPPADTQSELAVPFLFDNRVVGLLDIQSDRLGAFTPDDLALFETLADNVAVAVHNADLYRSEQWRRQVADSLREVAGLISANVGVEQVLEAILTELERNLPSDVAAIWLLDGDDIFLAAVHGCDPEALERARAESPRAAVWLATALLSEAPIIRRPDDPIGPSGEAAGFEPGYSSIAVPLRVANLPVGVLTLAHHTAGRYGHEAQAMATTFASYAAVAIENARLYDAAQEQAYASAALLQVAQAVVSLNDLDEILGTIVRIMPILVGVSRSALYLWDAEAERYIPCQSYGLGEAGEARLWHPLAPGDFPLLDAARLASLLLIAPLGEADTPEAWPELPGPWLDEASPILFEDERLLLCVPVAIKNDLYGLLLVQEAPDGLRFRTRRFEILHGIVQQAALAIQNDRLQKEMVLRERLETEVQLARQIQQTFIPETLPVHPGWDIAARWHTARQVGGDFYDVFELPGGKLGLFIADVADKGIPAALFMALTRTLVRAAVIETDSPADALRRVNDLLVPDTQQGMFVTAVYAVLTLETGELTYANAGHNPPLWMRRAEGRLERLTRTGMALGVLDASEFTERTLALGKGDCLLFYTDGVTESFSPAGEMYGEERLQSVLGARGSGSVHEMLDAVESELQAFTTPLPAADDLTMLAVCRGG